MQPSQPPYRHSAQRWACALAALSSLACSTALAMGPSGAQARVRPATSGDTPPIDRALLSAPTPQLPTTDDPALEKAMENLRSTAQTNPPSMSRKMPPLHTLSEPTPSEAAWLLGLLALHGKAVPIDPVQAQHWFERAHLLDNPLAAAGLAWCHIEGCSGVPNTALARSWIERLRKVDPGRALYLEWTLQNRLAPLDIASAATAPRSQTAPTTPPLAPPFNDPAALQQRDLLLRAARAGDSNALNELGLENVANGQLQAALGQFQAAARQSDAAANNVRLLLQRLDTAPMAAPAQARSGPNAAMNNSINGSVNGPSNNPLGSAATGPSDGSSSNSSIQNPAFANASTAWLQARKYHQADGVPANYAEAIRLYQLAASQGSQRARHMLELIYSRPGPQGGVDIAWMQQLASLDLGPDGAVLSSPLPTAPPLFGRDPTPLYDLLPKHWRSSPRPTQAPPMGVRR